MEYKEEQVEELIYSSPWLLNENYLVPKKIEGSKGEFGRQINIGRKNPRYIDLLFKDTGDERPVIVEMKRGKIKREDIAQILEYRALIVSMPEDKKEQWIAEFGQNYYAPKMVLMGNDIDFETMLSANLAGVEYRCFGKTNKLEFNLDEIDNIKAKIEEWNALRMSGSRGPWEREKWTKKIVNQTNSILNKIGNGLSTIKRQPTLNEKDVYQEQTLPFLNLPIKHYDDGLLGIYEYYKHYLPFNNEYIYLDICIDQFYKSTDKKVEAIIDRILLGFPHERLGDGDDETVNPYFKIDRHNLNEENFETFLRNSVSIAQKLQKEIKNTTQHAI